MVHGHLPYMSGLLMMMMSPGNKTCTEDYLGQGAVAVNLGLVHGDFGKILYCNYEPDVPALLKKSMELLVINVESGAQFSNSDQELFVMRNLSKN